MGWIVLFSLGIEFVRFEIEPQLLPIYEARPSNPKNPKAKYLQIQFEYFIPAVLGNPHGVTLSDQRKRKNEKLTVKKKKIDIKN